MLIFKWIWWKYFFQLKSAEMEPRKAGQWISSVRRLFWHEWARQSAPRLPTNGWPDQDDPSAGGVLHEIKHGRTGTSNLTLRKIANWMSKNCQKLVIFFKKIDKNCHFFQQNCHWQFCWKNVKFLAIYWHSIGNFPEGQLRVISDQYFLNLYTIILRVCQKISVANFCLLKVIVNHREKIFFLGIT